MDSIIRDLISSCEYIAIHMIERWKKNQYYQKNLSGEKILASSSFCICDDDNDIPLALACRKAYLPTISSKSMNELVDSIRDRIVVTEDIPNGIVGSLATEDALRRVLRDL